MNEGVNMKTMAVFLVLVLNFHMALAADTDLSNHYITASCTQDEVQFEDDEMMSEFFNQQNPQRYRIEIVQLTNEQVVTEYNGELIPNAVGGGAKTAQFQISIFDTTINANEPVHTLQVEGTAILFGGNLDFSGSDSGVRVNGDLWLRYGSQSPYISINGTNRRFTCEEGVQMVERGSVSQTSTQEVLNEEVMMDETSDGYNSVM